MYYFSWQVFSGVNGDLDGRLYAEVYAKCTLDSYYGVFIG
jgi:hypothetical protein